MSHMLLCKYMAYGGDSETVALQGTIGTPITATEVQSSPTNAEAMWSVTAVNAASNLNKGKMQKRERNPSVGTAYQNVSDWVVPNAFTGTYWLRVTLVSGGTPTSGTLNTWLALTANYPFGNTTSADETRNSLMKFEIATDSGGSNIVATGYYRALATRTP